MRVIAKSTLRAFWQSYPDARVSLEEWYVLAEKADWQNPNEVTDAVSSARYLGNERFSFKIRGNRYRLVVRIIFEFRRVYIRFVGTHAEYDKIDAKNV